ncbi:hypothetical protein NEDG_01656 [Nematocida displodere]|uniref:FYR N-terminal domain-containing protein n=1 Tax=Nematocida displodere TaxID=1805483 RepID=A0A177EGZ9_9MICR|nr:hypothetical protein NEDG_01656 [Nematocida displodere]
MAEANSSSSNAQLNEYISQYIEIRKRAEDKKKELQGLKNRRDALLDLLVYIKGQGCPTSSDLGVESVFPLVLGKAHSKFSITSVGMLPPEECFGFYNHSYIYPPGFKSRRKYNSSNRVEAKVLYYCQIRNVDGECIFEIRSSSGKVWSGKKEQAWSSFTSEFEKISFPSIESFFGLGHETVQKIIEELGDISVFSTYIPYKVRNRKGRKAKRDGEQ